jgi:hypothetical protein
MLQISHPIESLVSLVFVFNLLEGIPKLSARWGNVDKRAPSEYGNRCDDPIQRQVMISYLDIPCLKAWDSMLEGSTRRRRKIYGDVLLSFATNIQALHDERLLIPAKRSGVLE